MNGERRPRTRRRLGIALAGLLVAPAAARAQGEPTRGVELPGGVQLPEGETGERVAAEDLDLESLLELEVSAATKQPIKISDLPSTASAVTRAQLRDYGWRSLNQVLTTLPGFAPSQDYERRTIGFRGEREPWNNNRLLILMDGMPHNGIETGTAYTAAATPVFFAQKVEVIRGPASAVYGSNALHGVVAVQTVGVDDLGDGGVEARLRAGTGTQTLEAVGAQRADWADAVVGLSAHHADGDDYMDTDDSYRLDERGELARFRVGDEQEVSYLWLKLQPRLALDGLTISLHRQGQTAQTGHGWSAWIPDVEDEVTESRTIVELDYRKTAGPATFDQALQYQRARYFANTRSYPAGAFDGMYPDGVTEVVDTHFHSLVGRSQVQVVVGPEIGLLAGLEYAGVLNRGDTAHYSNVFIDDPTGEAPPVDGFRDIAPVYEPIVDRPVHKVGALVQAVSGGLLGDRLELTTGLRYDNLFFRYEEIATPARPVVSDSHQQLSPRAALVARVTDSLRLKAMAGHAYRTPSLVELFASNSRQAASNPRELAPESSTTLELAADWAIAAPVRLRANGFFIRHRNIIDYAFETGLLNNLFSNRRIGAEAEVLVETDVGGLKLDGFASYSHVRLLDETVLDPTLSEAGALVWSPAHLVKAGARAAGARLGGTVSAYAQGQTRRRASDRVDVVFRAERPVSVPGWIAVDASLFARVRGGLRVGVEGQNLLGTTGGIIAPGDHSFDYRVPARQILGVIDLDL